MDVQKRSDATAVATDAIGPAPEFGGLNGARSGTWKLSGNEAVEES